jgi:hypothetical protein
MQPPKIDARSRQDLAAQLRQLLAHHSPKLSYATGGAEMNEAMLQVFARFGEIVIDRLNKAPEKNFLAFLQLLGATNLPPRAARVPLTFYLANGAQAAVVPERTQVAAGQLPGETDPVLFETESELVVFPNRLSSLFVKNGAQGLYADLSRLLPQTPPASPAATPSTVIPASTFRGGTIIPHEFYINFNLSSPAAVIDRLLLNLGINANEAASAVRPSIEWRLFISPPPTSPKAAGPAPPPATPPANLGSDWIAHEPAGDTTDNLTKSGEIAFTTVSIPQALAPNSQTCWLLCRLLTPVGCDEDDQTAKGANPVLHGSDLPVIKSMIASLEIDRAGLALDGAFFNNAALDLTKDFFPFGEKPKFGDTFYLASREAFSTEEVTVTLHVEMTNPVDAQGQLPVPKVAPHEIKLAWEFWDGRQWSELGISVENVAPSNIVSPAGTPVHSNAFKDSTSAFSRSGDITITFPSRPVLANVAMMPGFWLRVRIVAGGYGVEAHRQRELTGHEDVPASFAPPMIHSIKAAYVYRRSLQPQALLSRNDFIWTTFTPEGLEASTGNTVRPFKPVASEEAKPALYFGFDPPSSPARLATYPVSMYVDADRSATGVSSIDPVGQQFQWQYWNGSQWLSLSVRDETSGLSQPALVRFITPSDFLPGSRFGCNRFWIRAVPSRERNSSIIRGVFLNTVMARGGVTHLNETLGVSNGTPGQAFPLLQKPVLTGQHIEIFEPRLPGYQGTDTAAADGSSQGVPTDTANCPAWLRWYEVEDFYASGPHDRHYLLDRLKGIVQFGDGVNGQIPPRAAAVRASTYRTGGGAIGNRPAGNINQLTTSVPSVTAAWNWIAADGGGDAEDNQAVLERGTKALRHGNRAVTAQDYEDLARLATPEVARARCVPQFDLLAHPDGSVRKPGAVSIIVVPRSDDARPVPGTQLLECVLAYLERYSPPAVQISVVVPSYLRIDVATEVVVDDPESAFQVLDAIKSALAAFLHPLTGGAGKGGWPFGRTPHKSDLYTLIASLPQVSYIRSVDIFAVAERGGTEQMDWFLIFPGTFDVSVALSPRELTAASGGANCR